MSTHIKALRPEQLHRANIDMVRFLLDELEDANPIDYADLGYEIDYGAKRLAMIHTALIEDWDGDRYWAESSALNAEHAQGYDIGSAVGQ